MIIHDRATNNRLGLFFVSAAILLLGLVPLLSGCGNDDESTSSQDRSSKTGNSPQANLCGVTVDATAWKVFDDLTNRNVSGQEMHRTDFQEFADLPIMTPWKKSMTGNLSSVRIVNWLDETFNPASGKKSKVSQDRIQFSASYRYTIEHRQDIDPLIKKFQTDGHACNFMKKVKFWFSEDVTPDSLVVAFLPSKPEIRVFENILFVDTGVLQAGNLQQLENQLTGILFRARMQLPGDPPTACEGQAAVANSFRVMMNEGISGYIEDLPRTIFSPDHPKLGSVNIIPESVFGHGIKGLSLVNFQLPAMLTSEKKMESLGYSLAKTLIASNSLNQGGYAMSATIAANLGEEVLRDTAGSPVAWVTAYQKAARMNPVPAPEPHEVMDQLHLSMVPYDDQVFEGILKILNEAFPTP